MGKHHHEKRPYYKRHPYRVAFMLLTSLLLVAVIVTHFLPTEWSVTIGIVVGTIASFLEKVEE